MKTKDAMITRLIRLFGRAIAGLAILAFSTMALPAAAQTSAWTKMSVVGDMNGWNNAANMSLVSDNVWMADLYCYSTPRMAFKFCANQEWAFQWGETNANQFEPPIYFVADYNSPYGSDIVMSNVTSGIYRFLFDDSTGTSSVEKIRDVSASYSRMAVAGGMNGWSASPNMTLVSNYMWQADLYVSDPTTYFKFVPEENWGLGWGESNQTWFTVPMTNTAEYKADYSKDCRMQISSSGVYRFTFVDTNGLYTIRCLRGGRANNSAMAVPGTFNGWSVLPNMELVADYTWQATINFANHDTIWFKFAANGSWSKQWGDTNLSLRDIPIMGTAELVDYNDFQINGPLDGKYYFRFNDQTLYYEVVPEGVVETFNNWQPAGSYKTYTNNGWVAYNALVTTTNSRYGLCVQLRDSTVTNQWLMSPFLPGGVTRVSFWLRSMTTNTPAMTYDLQTSTNGSNWTTFTAITGIRTLTYTNYSYDLNMTNGVYVRLKHNGGGTVALIDDFIIVLPFADARISDVALNPAYPWSNETVSVSAIIVTNLLATNLAVSMNYKVGSTGTYSSISMTGASNYYTTSSSIPAKPSGTLVYYYITATFGGPGSRSPQFWPAGGSNNPAWYGISHCRQGSVWINEFNAESDWFDPETNEFIELCSLAQSDIGGWTIELYDSVNVQYAAYPIQNNTILPNDDAGFGFYVFGNSNTPNVNVVFIHTPDGVEGYLKSSGGFKILNEFNTLQYALSYGQFGTNMYGFTCVGSENWLPTDDVLAMTGYGSNYTDFAWTTNDVSSPGQGNFAQTLVDGYVAPLPSLSNVAFVGSSIQSQVVIRASSTNGWISQPYYTSIVTNQWTQWIPIASYNSSYANGVITVWFDYPTGVTNAFFRLKSNPSW